MVLLVFIIFWIIWFTTISIWTGIPKYWIIKIW